MGCALVEMEFTCHEGAEIKRVAAGGQLGDPLTKSLNRLALFSEPRKRQMRGVGVGFLLHSQGREGIASVFSKSGQRRIRLHTRKEDFRTVWIRQEPEARHTDLKGARFRQPGKGAFKLRQASVRPLPDEFNGDVQVFKRRPAQFCRGT